MTYRPKPQKNDSAIVREADAILHNLRNRRRRSNQATTPDIVRQADAILKKLKYQQHSRANLDTTGRFAMQRLYKDNQLSFLMRAKGANNKKARSNFVMFS